MTPSWPSFWEHIPQSDRAAVSEILGDLLGTGVIFGDAGRDRQLFELARLYRTEVAEYLAPLGIELFQDPDRPLFQARPIPGECPLTTRFSKDETLVVLTLWRIYDDHRMMQTSDTAMLTANDLDARLRLYFEKIVPPTPAHLERILAKLRRKRLIRYQTNDERPGESGIEILPTLARAIPFEGKEWEEQVALYQTTDQPSADQSPDQTPAGNGGNGDTADTIEPEAAE